MIDLFVLNFRFVFEVKKLITRENTNDLLHRVNYYRTKSVRGLRYYEHIGSEKINSKITFTKTNYSTKVIDFSASSILSSLSTKPTPLTTTIENH